MKILYGDSTLADSSARLWPAGLRVDGQRVADVSSILRAAEPAIFARGNTSHTITFTVSREYASHRDAQKAALTANSYYPGKAVLELQCGEAGETSASVFAAQAVLAGLSAVPVGVSVQLAYSFTTGRLLAEAPPDFVVGGEAVIQSNTVEIPSGAESVVVVFSPAFPGDGDVVVQLTVESPEGQPKIYPQIEGGTPGPEGFTALLSAVTPDEDYRLHWTAIQKPD